MTSNNQELSAQKDGSDTSNNDPKASKSDPPANSATTLDEPSFGWSGYAERVNGRFAMLGFIAILLIEALSNETFLRWSGLLP